MASSTSASTAVVAVYPEVASSGAYPVYNLPISIISESQVLIGTTLHTLTEPIGPKNYQQRAANAVATATETATDYRGNYLDPGQYRAPLPRPVMKQKQQQHADSERSQPLPPRTMSSLLENHPRAPPPPRSLPPGPKTKTINKAASKIPSAANVNVGASKYKREPASAAAVPGKRSQKFPSKAGGVIAAAASSKKKKCKNGTPVSVISNPADLKRITAAMLAVITLYGGKSGRELGALDCRGVTMRPSGKWQAQLYYAGKSRYIGVYETKEKALMAYEIAREVLRTERDKRRPLAPAPPLDTGEETYRNLTLARKAAYMGVCGNSPKRVPRE